MSAGERPLPLAKRFIDPSRFAPQSNPLAVRANELKRGKKAPNRMHPEDDTEESLVENAADIDSLQLPRNLPTVRLQNTAVAAMAAVAPMAAADDAGEQPLVRRLRLRKAPALQGSGLGGAVGGSREASPATRGLCDRQLSRYASCLNRSRLACPFRVYI